MTTLLTAAYPTPETEDLARRLDAWQAILHARPHTSPEEAMTQANAVVDAAIAAFESRSAARGTAPADPSAPQG